MVAKLGTVGKWLAIGGLLVVISQLFAADWMMTDGWWCTWIAMGSFILVSAFLPPIQAGVAGFVLGCLSIGTAFWWAQRMLAYTLDQEGIVPKSVFVGLVVWEALVFAIVGYSVSRIRNQTPHAIGLLLPVCLWIVAETYWPRVFCWTLGHSQQGYLPWVQVADLGGASAITVVVWCGASVPLLIFDSLNSLGSSRSKRARRGLLAVLAIISLIWSYGTLRIHEIDRSSSESELYRIGVVQEDPSYRDAIEKMRSRSDSLGTEVQLFVWPESTLSIHSLDLKSFADPVAMLELTIPPHVETETNIGFVRSADCWRKELSWDAQRTGSKISNSLCRRE